MKTTNTPKSRKLLALLLCLCMVLGLMPAMSLSAAAVDTPARTTMLDLTATSLSYVDNSGNTVTGDPTTASIDATTNEGWSWDVTTKTLTLSGAHINIPQITDLTATNKDRCGIYYDAGCSAKYPEYPNNYSADAGTFNIVLAAGTENSITMNGTNGDLAAYYTTGQNGTDHYNTCGISYAAICANRYIATNITGGGNLTIDMMPAQATSSSVDSTGIKAYYLTLDNTGAIDIIIRELEYQKIGRIHGVYAATLDVNAGTLNIKQSDLSYQSGSAMSIGVWIDGHMTIADGTVNISPLNPSDYTEHRICGIWITDGHIGETSNSLTMNGGFLNITRYPKSKDVAISGHVVMNGGKADIIGPVYFINDNQSPYTPSEINGGVMTIRTSSAQSSALESNPYSSSSGTGVFAALQGNYNSNVYIAPNCTYKYNNGRAVDEDGFYLGSTSYAAALDENRYGVANYNYTYAYLGVPAEPSFTLALVPQTTGLLEAGSTVVYDIVLTQSGGRASMPNVQGINIGLKWDTSLSYVADSLIDSADAGTTGTVGDRANEKIKDNAQITITKNASDFRIYMAPGGSGFYLGDGERMTLGTATFTLPEKTFIDDNGTDGVYAVPDSTLVAGFNGELSVNLGEEKLTSEVKTGTVAKVNAAYLYLTFPTAAHYTVNADVLDGSIVTENGVSTDASGKSYHVAVNNAQHSASAAFTAAAVPGYELGTLTATNGGVSGGYSVTGMTQNSTLTIPTTPQEYAITWKLGDGTANTATGGSATYNIETTSLTLPTEPTRTGYDFNGWKVTSVAHNGTDTNVGTLSTMDSIITADPFTAGAYGCTVEITAQWTPVEHTTNDYGEEVPHGDVVQTDPKNDEDPPAVIDPFTEDIVGLTITPDPGYKLDSVDVVDSESPANNITIYSGPAATEEFLFDDDNPLDPTGDDIYFEQPATDVIVTPHYSAISYSVTYDVDGGAELAAGSYNVENTSFTLPTPTKTGYDFVKWTVTTAAAGGTGFAANDEYAAATPITAALNGAYGNVTLKAVWTPAEQTGNNYGGTVPHGAVDPTPDSPPYPKTNDVVSVTITPDAGYDLTGVTVKDSADPIADVTIYTTNTDGVLSDVLTTPTATGDTIYFYQPTTAVTVTPEYTPIEYSITWLDTDATTNHVGGDATYNIEDTTLVLPTAPERSGYTFAGWKVTAAVAGVGAFSTTDASVTGTITAGSYGAVSLYPTWTANPHSGNNYESNPVPADHGDVTHTPATPVTDEIVALTVNPDEGYYLSGLAISDGTNPVPFYSDYEAKTEVTYPTDGSDVTVYFKQPATDVTVTPTYAPRTFTIPLSAADATTAYTDKTVVLTYDSATVPTIEVPVRSGYTFAGWYTAAENGTMIIDAEGALIASVDGYTGAGGIWKNIATPTLYAHWTQSDFTITWSQNGSPDAASTITLNDTTATKIYTVGTTEITFPAAPTWTTTYAPNDMSSETVTRYAFAGWRVKPGSGSQAGSALVEGTTWPANVTSPAAIVAGSYGNVTIEAVWEPVDWSVSFTITDVNSTMTGSTATVGINGEKIPVPTITQNGNAYTVKTDIPGKFTVTPAAGYKIKSVQYHIWDKSGGHVFGTTSGTLMTPDDNGVYTMPNGFTPFVKVTIYTELDFDSGAITVSGITEPVVDPDGYRYVPYSYYSQGKTLILFNCTGTAANVNLAMNSGPSIFKTSAYPGYTHAMLIDLNAFTISGKGEGLDGTYTPTGTEETDLANLVKYFKVNMKVTSTANTTVTYNWDVNDATEFSKVFTSQDVSVEYDYTSKTSLQWMPTDLQLLKGDMAGEVANDNGHDRKLGSTDLSTFVAHYGSLT